VLRSAALVVRVGWSVHWWTIGQYFEAFPRMSARTAMSPPHPSTVPGRQPPPSSADLEANLDAFWLTCQGGVIEPHHLHSLVQLPRQAGPQFHALCVPDQAQWGHPCASGVGAGLVAAESSPTSDNFSFSRLGWLPRLSSISLQLPHHRRGAVGPLVPGGPTCSWSTAATRRNLWPLMRDSGLSDPASSPARHGLVGVVPAAWCMTPRIGASFI